MANSTVINVMKKLLPLILMIFTFSLSAQVMADDMADMEKMSSELNQVNKKLSRGEFEGRGSGRVDQADHQDEKFSLAVCVK